MLYFEFASTDEICRNLGKQLRGARLAQGLQQAELAARAGVARATVAKLESQGQSTLQTLVRLAQALGLERGLEEVFRSPVTSIAEMERADRAQHRRRAPKRRALTDAGS